ncbi:hypothetical protein VTN00DRAFT_6602 [Thermoascus crustaceus]|uniref:uncharacterized protein n=1 Tax=Thermoascus crustaceus TaxID=5088 RepID=UPI0037438183
MGLHQGHEASGSSHRDVTIEQLVQRLGRPDVLDDLIRLRAADDVQVPILAYPRGEDNAANYEYFSGCDLDRLVDQAVRCLMERGFAPASHNDESIVALLTLSDLDMVITFFALSRLGYTVMMLSPRLSAAACVSLLETAKCNTILYGQTPNIRSTIEGILQLKHVSSQSLLSRSAYDSPCENSGHPLQWNRDNKAQREKIALVLHSSGSTGTPKPIYLTHKALMTHPLRGPGFTSFNSLPWYHLHGLSTAFQAMWRRKTAFMWNASLPLTSDSLVTALEASQPESVSTVPYVLQLLAENPRGIEALRKCKMVTYGGAACPDELGDKLVQEGVKFAAAFGSSEAGFVAESISRPEGDTAWNYVFFFDNIRPFIWMKPIGDGLYESVYLSGHPALTTSNSDDPPGSYHSRDVFAPHPTLPDRWKYITRLDDRITLVNGEKVLPLPIEGRIKQHPLVREAVMVGVNKTAPGLLIFRSEASNNLSDEEFLCSIWSTVEEANSRAEQFSQITREMIAILPLTARYPMTDKGSLIRAQVYSQFSGVIEDLYAKVERSDGTLELDIPATEAHLMKVCQKELGLSIPSPESGFFAMGVDSLKALHLRRLVLRYFKLGSKKLSLNVIFETGNICRLAEHIHSLQTGKERHAEDELSLMPSLIEKYSAFRKHVPHPASVTNGKGVILTGATGSLGAHTLSHLLQEDDISVIYCLTRREHPKEALLEALQQRGLNISQAQTKKIIAFKSALDEPYFGLEAETLREMQDCVSLIIHTAWPVNFNLPLLNFETHIKGLYNLIQFSLSVNLPAPAVLLFCSSISTVLGLPPTTIVEEQPMKELASSLDMGYGRSKLVGEHIVSNARKSGARAYSLRIGQISGDSRKGIWNESEAVPLMLRSALTLRTLPDLQCACSWLPVDTLASTILDLAKTCSQRSASTPTSETNGNGDFPTTTFVDDSVYNICNPYSFTWTSLLTELRRAGITFKTVSFDTWISMMRESQKRCEERVNPAVKLVGHYEAMYSPASADKKRGVRRYPEQFVTEKVERDSVTLRDRRPRIIEDGILSRYIRFWLDR